MILVGGDTTLVRRQTAYFCRDYLDAGRQSGTHAGLECQR
jgi:hypothetical protein